MWARVRVKRSKHRIAATAVASWKTITGFVNMQHHPQIRESTAAAARYARFLMMWTTKLPYEIWRNLDFRNRCPTIWTTSGVATDLGRHPLPHRHQAWRWTRHPTV